MQVGWYDRETNRLHAVKAEPRLRLIFFGGASVSNMTLAMAGMSPATTRDPDPLQIA